MGTLLDIDKRFPYGIFPGKHSFGLFEKVGCLKLGNRSEKNRLEGFI